MPRRCEAFLGPFWNVEHFANMTQTVLLMLLRHAGGCGELGLVTAHSAPSGVVTVTRPHSPTRPGANRRAGAAAALRAACATEAWIRAAPAAARASAAACRACGCALCFTCGCACAVCCAFGCFMSRFGEGVVV